MPLFSTPRSFSLTLVTYFSLSLSAAHAGWVPSSKGLSDSVVFEELAQIPSGWIEQKHAHPETPIVMRMAMKPAKDNAHKMAEAFFAVSNPDNARYGQFLSKEDLTSLTSPSASAKKTAERWLALHNVTSFDFTNEWLIFGTNVETAEKMLDTTFNWYSHISASNGKLTTDKLALRTLSYSVPSAISNIINMIQPTTRFGEPKAQRSAMIRNPKLDMGLSLIQATAAVPDGCVYNNITASCLRQYYGINDFHVNPATSGKIAFASFLEEYARYNDLQLYEENFLPNAAGQSFAVELINGGLNDQNSDDDSGEANLDVQAIVATSNPLPVLEYSTGGRGPLIPDLDQPEPPAGAMNSNEPYLPFIQYLLAQPQEDLPHTISISYGESEQELPLSYMRQVCNGFMQLGLRGVSVLASSGDFGPGASCSSNGQFGYKVGQPIYLPAFPTSCPYITSVGGTYQFAPERAVPFGGGGFSDVFARPAYQEAAVSSYLELTNYNMSQYYNETSRAYPDVSALGYALAIYDKNELTRIAGTSMSCPIFAGVVGNLNGARLSSGKKPLGFLNPWLYSLNNGELKDITNGKIVGCDGSLATGADTGGIVIPGAGFVATVGWDAATGLGTPNFPALLATALTTA